MGELKKVLAGEADVPGTGVVEVVEGHPEARRNETAFEKLDRNWGDLLQELLVAHRRYFGRQIKHQTVAWGNLFVKICLAGLALLLIGCVAFITHLVLPDVVGWIVAGATAVVITAVMTLLPPRSSVPVQK